MLRRLACFAVIEIATTRPFFLAMVDVRQF